MTVLPADFLAAADRCGFGDRVARCRRGEQVTVDPTGATSSPGLPGDGR
ncbi:hypothetical protein [Streptomyces sp. NPDC058374]